MSPVSACGDVTDDHLSAITSLDLERKSISALKAGDFGGLTALTSLDLNNNGITTSLPANVFFDLSALETLILRSNHLGGSLDANVFSGLTALKHLDMSNTRITSLPATIFSGLSALEHLDLENTRITSLPATVFSGLSALEHLDISRNNLGSLDANVFSGLTALEHLDLQSLGLTSVPTNLFSGLTALEHLDLTYNNNLTDLPATLFSGLTRLRTLNLRTNDVSTLPNGLLSDLTDLRSLDLRQMDLSTLPDGVFSGLTKLTQLWLQFNPVDPLPITVSLESAGTNQFRAKAHTGAPFDMILPLRVTNGFIDSGESSIQISQGDVESNTLSVFRTAGSTAVTIDIVSPLPVLPASHNGYEPVRSGNLPLVVIAPEGEPPTLSAPTLTISGNRLTLAFTDDFAANETRAYQVRIRHKTNQGPWATGCHTETNDEASQQSISVTLQDDISDFFEPGTTYEADYGYLGTECRDYFTGLRSATAEFTTSGTPSFDIDIVFVGNISSTYRSHVEDAAERWEEIITGDIPNHRLTTANRNYLNGRFPGTTAPEVVDDLVIYVRTVNSLTGIAAATSWLHRDPSYLPFASEIQLGTRFEIDYLAALHEMGHALGFGTDPWTAHDLLKNPSRGIDPAPDTHFSGAKAIAAFNAAGGSSYTGAKVPVENASSNASSRDSHWRGSVMQSELMTPGGFAPNPLSAITIQAMADIGYTVDVTQADAYTLPSSKPAIGSEGLIPLNCVIEHSEARRDKPEPIILNLKRVDN